MILKLLRKYLKPHWKLLVAVAIFQAAQAIAALLLPSLNADIIDNGVAKGDIGHITSVGMVMLGITSFRSPARSPRCTSGPRRRCRSAATCAVRSFTE